MANEQTRNNLENSNLFKCSFCGLNKRIEFLDSVLDEAPTVIDIQEKVEGKESEKVRLEEQFFSNNDVNVQKELQEKINEINQEIIRLFKSSETRKKYLCITCRLGSKKKIEPVKFTCEICKVEKNGEGIKMHVGNWEGINKRVISKICRDCIEDYALTAPADFYCPLNSEGRDDWDRPQFDCVCKVPSV